LAVALVILGGLAYFVDLDAVWREIRACRMRWVLLGAVAHYATYPVRGVRWRRCLKYLPLKCGNVRFGLLVFFYNAVDNVVPAKLGDVYGAHLARINCGVSRSTAIGSLVFARMLDAWLVLAMAFSASWVLFGAHLPRSVSWALVGGGGIALAATLVMLVFFLLKRVLPAWVPDRIRPMIQDFQTGMWPRASELVPIALLSLAVWALETLWVFLLLKGFGLPTDFCEMVFLTAVPLLASAVPITPAGAGLVEITLFSCLRVVGVASPTAASVTVLNRAMDYWLHILLGLMIWVARKRIGLRTYREMT